MSKTSSNLKMSRIKKVSNLSSVKRLGNSMSVHDVIFAQIPPWKHSPPDKGPLTPLSPLCQLLLPLLLDILHAHCASIKVTLFSSFWLDKFDKLSSLSQISLSPITLLPPQSVSIKANVVALYQLVFFQLIIWIAPQACQPLPPLWQLELASHNFKSRKIKSVSREILPRQHPSG